MKRSLKKTIAFVLALALAIQFMVFEAPAKSVFASELSDFDISEDGTCVWGYYGTDEDVVIPADSGITYVSLWVGENIKSITIPEGVESVSISADAIEKLALPSTLSYLYLSYCPALKEIDLSKVVNTPEYYNSYEIMNCNKLETIKFGKLMGYINVNGSESLRSLDLSKTDLDEVYIWECPNLTDIKFNKDAQYISLGSLDSIKNAVIPENASLYLCGDINFDNITVKNNKNGYSIKDGGLYHEYYNSYYDADFKCLEAIDFSRKTINVAEGTLCIDNLSLSGNYYKTEVINFPDSVEIFGYYAFEGGDKIKEFNFPKNLITMQSYCFSGFNPDVELVLPESLKDIDYDAFAGFKGKVTLEKETPSLSEYKDGIYYYYLDENDERSPFAWLMYYPSDKTSIEFKPDTTYISPDVFKGSAIKSLDIPEGVMWLDLNLKTAWNLTSISIPASVSTIYAPMIGYAPALKKVTVHPDNEYYCSYKNCIYTKDMYALIDVPGALENIEIPEGVVSLNYYTVSNHFISGPEEDIYIQPTVSFPKTIEEYDYYSLSFKSAKVYADTPIAQFIVNANEEFKYYADYYGYEPELYEYTLRDSNKDLLNMIYVVDSIGIKKGKKTTISVDLPIGLNAVSKLSLGNNTECSIKFSSSDKKVATVNSKTGVVKAKKKGTCTINVKCTIDNGKKKTSKTFKVKLKVK